MKNRFIAFVLGLFLVEQSTAAFAASVTLIPKTQPIIPVLVLDTGAVGRVCLTSPTVGKLDTSTCKPFTIPQDSVMGTPIEVTPPTTKSRAWISQGDPAAFPHLAYVVYGWKTARSLPIQATIPEGFTLGRKSFGKKGKGLQFVPNAKGVGLTLTTEAQLAAMQKFRAALRVAMIAALKDIGTISHKNTRLAYDCGGGDMPIDNPEMRIGAAPKTSNVICGEDSGGDPGQIGGGVSGAWGGEWGDGGGYNDAGDYGDWGAPSGPWTEQSFDDFAGQMVDMDFTYGMADFAVTMANKMPKCTQFIQTCKDTCDTLRNVEAAGCATLGTMAGAFLSPAIGGALTFYCGTKIAIASAQCTQTCSTPTQFQCEN
jgi:hypothetical protein